MNKKNITSFCCSALILSGAFFSHQSMANEADQLKQKLANVASLHSTFKQTVIDVNNKVIQQGEGTFALATPSKLYWHLTQPDESLIVTKGDNVWIYNPFAEEVTVMNLEQAIASSPMTLLIHRDDKTWSNYDVTKHGHCFDIKPKAMDVNVSKVESCFDNDQLSKFVIHDAQGNTSTFDLSDQRTLKTSESSLFDFTPPEGVDIDDQRQTSTKH
ncbi:outer membrane lipoprotein chaperone LolA [Shewanella sp. 202IG2-18]|uniref:outer membrane lipoprotein chaperone LolA n=1 Tax=Parashewanella hymeniacidonis TaxID=2807618 RepID=UPI0019605F3D|nr:outer membrane lipoprotein chaperone LolA [Parashewanella hymeniacidonis]MBM7071901.1 outer membrane lipoprotein chaperone LolA [Parashewanella hymeniacidonis]